MSVDPVSLGLTLATTAASMALNASRRIDGPRLQELAVSTADYGTPVLELVGTRMLDAFPIIWAEKRKEVIQRRKTKGGKTSNAIYFGTWAVLVAGHPCEAVLQLLFNKQLVYDATGAGPVTPFAIGYSTVGKSGRPRERTIDLADHMRIHYGAEDQLPDPRMQATIDAEHGAGSTPAYRGVTIVVFEDVPLEKFGNQVPTVGGLVAHAANPAYPYDSFAVSPNNGRLWNTVFSPDGTRLFWADSAGAFELWHLPTRTRLAAGDFGPGINLALAGMFSDGRIAVVGGANDVLHFLSEDGVLQSSLALTADNQDGVFVRTDADGVDHWMTTPWSASFIFYLDGTELDMTVLTGASWRPTGYFSDLDGNIWACGAGTELGVTTAYFYRVVQVRNSDLPGSVTVTGLPASTSALQSVNAVHVRDGDTDRLVFNWDNDGLYSVDPADGSIVVSNPASFDVFNIDKQMANLAPGASTLWANSTQIDLWTLDVVTTVDLTDWVAQDADGILYAPILDALLCWPQFTSALTIRYLNRAGGGSDTLGGVAALIAARCGLDDTDHDFSALTTPIRGYSWTRGSGKDIVDPLREIFDADVRDHGFVLQGIERGGAAGAAIVDSDFARADRDDPAFGAPTDGDTDLPRLLRLTFADADADQQVNAALAPRLSGGAGAVRDLALDMSNLALTATEAQQLAERMMRRRIFDRQSYPLALTMEQAAIEPGDVHPLTLAGEVVTASLRRQSVEADGSIAAEWTRDDPSVHLLSGSDGAAQDGWVTPEMFIPVPTRALVADVPLASDAHDSAVPFLYFGAAPRAAGAWPGAEWQVSDSTLAADFVGPWASTAASDAMTWGFTTAAIGTALPWLFDRGTSIAVRMGAGATLTSVTEDALLADGTLNLILVGGEYIQFATATLESDGSYTLTNLLRGCRGTEHAIGSHVAGETLALVDAKMFRREIGAGEIGDTDAYRATTIGDDPVASPATSIAFTAAAQRPYAPVHGLLLRDTGSGDWTIAATRRTRVGGANVDGGNVPLGEVSEAWEADIMDGATVVRTITGTSLPLTYSSADQTADWGSPQTDLTANLYQMSPALALRGFPLALAA